MKNRMI